MQMLFSSYLFFISLCLDCKKPKFELLSICVVGYVFYEDDHVGLTFYFTFNTLCSWKCKGISQKSMAIYESFANVTFTCTK